MSTLQKLSDTVNKVVSWVGAVFFVILIVACVTQVFFRFALNHSLSWTEELARYAFIWMHMIGSSLLICDGGHATVTAVLDQLSGSAKKLVEIFIEIVILVNGALMTYATRTNLSTAMSVPMWCINSSVFVGGALLILQAIVKMALITSSDTNEGGVA